MDTASPSYRLFQRLSHCTICLALSVVVVGCGGYGKVSPKAYEFSKSLYSISNQRSTERLEVINTTIHDAHQAGELNDKEFEWLNDIITRGKDGDWESARQASRRMMEDQVDR